VKVEEKKHVAILIVGKANKSSDSASNFVRSSTEREPSSRSACSYFARPSVARAWGTEDRSGREKFA
jgi:hypothetical protein